MLLKTSHLNQKVLPISETKNKVEENSMRIDILKEGDEVLSVNPGFIAVKRKNSEVDLIPLIEDPDFGLRVDTQKIVTIGFGDNETSAETEDGGFIINF